ncbi:MAG: arginine 2,3-aminomutase, partial [Symbiobacteriaceae bacterium]|nr:arginine 2,3-aminomutase [Symbiobacteriaceae bacterium]
IARLREIDHVEIIRIGTRMPSTLPMRITPQLVSMLRKYHPIWINTQFNHPRELTPQALLACSAIVDAGIPLGNQSVLLRGINDDPAIMKDLLLGLVKARIRPYYLYQCDLCEGVEHFRTRVETGIELMNSLIGNITGFAIPQYVIDAPEGGGKIPINPDFLISIDSQRVLMRNYKGDLYSYTQAQHPL